MPGYGQIEKDSIARMREMLGIKDDSDLESLKEELFGTHQQPNFIAEVKWENGDLVFRFKPMVKGVKFTKEMVEHIAMKMSDVSKSVAESMFAIGEFTLGYSEDEPSDESAIANLQRRILLLESIIKGDSIGLPIRNIPSEMQLPESVMDELQRHLDNLEKAYNSQENAERIKKQIQSLVAQETSRIKVDPHNVPQSPIPQGFKEKNNWNRTRSNPKLR